MIFPTPVHPPATLNLMHMISRRSACRLLAAASASVVLPGRGVAAAREQEFRLRYILASSMYGETNVAEILPEVKKVGADQIDIWPKVHGNQREQIEEMGHECFADLLETNGVKLGMLTCYLDEPPFRVEDEIAVAKKLGGRMVIAGGDGPKGLRGAELKAAVRNYVEKIKPRIALAEKHDIVLGIENHSGTLLDSVDGVRWFGELAASTHVGVALAPYHLPQDPKLLAELITDLGDKLVHFYAWQHGQGCAKKLPKDQELEQMPGRGELDFKPLVDALREIDYRGWTEIFMHPVPRGIPILETTARVTEEINVAREYLEMA
ncbi:sugar phosphate isomerase/epimerase [Pirellulales bacterium]|nr:sugar phosphate isomerase/epimerase [Pirellulales bacterium]